MIINTVEYCYVTLAWNCFALHNIRNHIFHPDMQQVTEHARCDSSLCTVMRHACACVALSPRHTHTHRRTQCQRTAHRACSLHSVVLRASVRFAPHCRPSANINYVRPERLMCSIYLRMCMCLRVFCLLMICMYRHSVQFLCVRVGGD